MNYNNTVASRLFESQKKLKESLATEGLAILQSNPDISKKDFVAQLSSKFPNSPAMSISSVYFSARRKLGLKGPRADQVAARKAAKDAAAKATTPTSVKKIPAKTRATTIAKKPVTTRATAVKDTTISNIPEISDIVDAASLLTVKGLKPEQIYNAWINARSIFYKKVIHIAIDNQSRKYLEFYIDRLFHVVNGESGSSLDTSYERSDKNIKDAYMYISRAQKICVGKSFERSKDGALCNVDVTKMPATKEDITSLYEAALYIAGKGHPKHSAKDSIAVYKKWFAGVRISGNWHDYEWGTKPYHIYFSSTDYDFSLGREEGFSATWSELLRDEELLEEFEESGSPYIFIQEMLEQGCVFNGKNFTQDMVA